MTRTRLGVAVGLCLGVGVAFAAVSSYEGTAAILSSGGTTAASSSIGGSGAGSGAIAAAGATAGTAKAAAGAGADSAERRTYIVVLDEPSVAAYKGGTGRLAAPGRTMGRNGKMRLDVHSASAREYVRHLRDNQSVMEASMARVARGSLQVRTRMQHALNAMVVDMSEKDADAIRKMAGVQFVEEDRVYQADTDHGPQLIGAPAVWDGSNPGALAAYQGEGMVIGVIDSGINFGSPSFAAVSPKDGYKHINPLGSGNFLGTCAPGGVDEGRCNDKLIGGYDFVCGPPSNTCSVPTYREEPGFGDTNSHGSHVASTIAGNRRDAVFNSSPVSISGVAPRANIVAYDVCYTDLADGRAWCPGAGSLAAINQSIADGVVDALNFSISGGGQPWSDAVSLGFLNAVDAGIFVAASAGNSGPAPNTLGHLEPWVSNTAAAQHGRGSFGFALQVTGPQPVPEPLAPALISSGVDGVVHDTPIPGTTALKLSPTFGNGQDGCSAFPADSFKGAIAVIQRGGCSFTIKTNSAAAAGAIAVVLVNNVAEPITPSVPDTTIRAFGLDLATGTELRNFLSAHSDATGGIGFPPIPLPNTPDALGGFSSRGPAGTFDLVKPDVTAPGVSILAVIAGDTLTGHENAVGLMNGTSMASPHQAGASLLVRQARPDWTVPEVKSALAMTADETVLLEDQVTPANAFAGGSGRIRVDKAINAGLVMDETKARYLAADPAKGGDVSALNQPSMARRNCGSSCEFVRTFRNPTSKTQSYRTDVEGVKGRALPALITVAPGATATIRVIVDKARLPADGSWNFGMLRLTPRGAGTQASSPLHLPIAVAVQPPVASLGAIDLTLRQGAKADASTVVRNMGGSELSYNFTRSGSGALPAYSSPGDTTTGYRGTIYTDQTSSRAEFAAEDFTVSQPIQLSRLALNFFMPGNGKLAEVSSEVSWSIFPDANGLPAGNPLTSPGTAVWSYTSAPAGKGIAINATELSLDLAAAGQSVTLQPGRYWLVVNNKATLANRMAWYASTKGNGGFASMAVPASGTPSWNSNAAFAGLSLRVDGLVSCSASWIGAISPGSGKLAPAASRTHKAAISASGLAPGSYQGAVCLASNDPVKPRAAGLVRLTVTQ